MSERELQNHLSVLRDFAEVAAGDLTLEVVPADPKDNHVLAVAIETNCAYLITGDRHLLDMGDYQGIRLHMPRDFLTLLEAADQVADDTSR